MEKDQENKTHDIYEHLLNLTTLSTEHHRNLKERGFTDEQIVQGGYKSLPQATRVLSEQMAEKFGEELAFVAGFCKRNGKEWMINASECLLIPMRNNVGLITAIKLKGDHSTQSKKYTMFTSSKADGQQSQDTCGSRAKTDCHFPLFKGTHKEGVVRITEGELKADLATLHGDTFTISIAGVLSWKQALPALRVLKPSKVLIAFDADKDHERSSSVPDATNTYEVGKCLSNLYQAIKNEGYPVYIETWNPSCGKGIDDVYVNGYEESIVEMSPDKAEGFVSEKLVDELTSDYVYIVNLKKFINVNNQIQYDKEQFDDKMASSNEEKGKPSQLFIKCPASPIFEQCVYAPDQGKTVYFHGMKCFNTWKENKIIPIDGDVTPFTDHFDYLLPNKEEANILLDWMAFNIQQKGKKISWAVLLQGEEGTGKSFIGEVLRRILGESNVSFPSNEALKERFNGWQKSCHVVVVEEIMAKGRIDLMNKLKPMITQDIATIRQMRIDEYTQPNVYNIIAYTNHDDSIVITETDRRYCVLNSPAKAKHESYYIGLFKWTADNIGIIYNFLINRDLSHFNPKSRAPHTDAKDALVETSYCPLQNWVHDYVEACAYPFNRDIVVPFHLLKEIPKGAVYNMNVAKLGRELKRFGFVSQGRVRLDEGQFTVYSCRNHDAWTSCDIEIKKKNIIDGTNVNGQTNKNQWEENNFQNSKPF